MISFFTTYKNFEGLLRVTQTNAIRSWKNLHPEVEIILFDKNAAAEKLACELGAIYVPEVARNEKGTPFLSEIFSQAQRIAKHSLCCFINCDIILGADFIDAARLAAAGGKRKFLMVGCRQDLDWKKPLDFSDSTSLDAFYRYAMEKGERHGVSGIDYFLFPRGFYRKIPQFLAGRAGFDNWLIWKARQMGLVIDASEGVLAVHQNHDYSHLKNSGGDAALLARTKVADKVAAEGEEGKYNLQFLGEDRTQGFNILDATWKIYGGKIVRKNSREEINRYLGRLGNLYPRWRLILNFYKRLYRRFWLAKA